MNRFSLVAFLCVLAAGPGAAQGLKPILPPASAASQQAPVEVEALHIETDFQADGTSVKVVTGVFHVLTEAGLKELAVLVFPYSSGAEAVETEYVRVKKTGGEVVATPPEATQDLTAEVARSAPMYSDIREKHVTVKGLAVGDTLEFRMRARLLKPEVPGQFWCGLSFVQDRVVREWVAQVSYPADMAVQVHSRGQAPETRLEGGRRILCWRRSNATPKEPPARAPWNGHPADDILVTTFRSWDELGSWYRTLAEPRAQVTPAIKAKAEELTRGLKGEEERAKAIYAFVALKIHYVGLSFGLGKYQPHPAEEVLTNGYGDCKDKTTLLASLLRASGLEAWPALIRAKGSLDRDAPTPGQFDHLITVVVLNGRRVWLDSTPEVAPFGFLMLPLRGKPALVVSRSGPASLQDTPAGTPFPILFAYDFHGQVGEGGLVGGHASITTRGDGELLFRNAFRQAPATRWPDLMARFAFLPGLGYEFSDIQPANTEDTRNPYVYQWDLKRDGRKDWESRRLMVPLPLINLGQLADAGKKASDPVFLPSEQTFRSRAVLELPEGSAPQLPQPVNLANPAGDYHATYTFEHGSLTVERRLTLHAIEIAPGDRKAFNGFVQGVDDDEQRYVGLFSGTGQAAFHSPEAMKAFQSGTEALQRNDYTAAREAFRRTLELAPGFPGAHGNFGITYLAKNDVSTGIRELLKEEELHPEIPTTYQILARVYEMQGRKREAIAQWKKALAKDPDDHETLVGLITLLHGEKEYEEAILQLESALGRDPDNTQCLLWLAQDYARCGRGGQVEAIAAKAVSHDGSPETLMAAARALAEEGQALGQARAWAEKAGTALEAASLTVGGDTAQGLANTQNLVGVWEALGRIGLLEGRPAEALRYLKAAWALDQRAGTGELLAQAYERLGRKGDAADQYELAAVADHADHEGIAQKYRKLTGRTLENGFGHAYANGKMLRSPAERLLSARTAHFPCKALQGTYHAVVELSAAGVEGVQLLEPSPDREAQTAAMKRLHLEVALPDAAPRRVFLKGGVEFGPRGGTFIHTVD